MELTGDISNAISLSDFNKDAEFICVYFSGPQDHFWTIKCPCGIEVHYAVNELPTTDTKHPCDNPKHWTVKWN